MFEPTGPCEFAISLPDGGRWLIELLQDSKDVAGHAARFQESKHGSISQYQRAILDLGMEQREPQHDIHYVVVLTEGCRKAIFKPPTGPQTEVALCLGLPEYGPF